jgi:hypothetical protein
MEDMTLEELKALVAENSRAISRQEKLQAERVEQWQEELRASRQQWQEELAGSRQQWQEQLDVSRRQGQEELAGSRQQWQEQLDVSRRQGQEELAGSRQQWQEQLDVSRRQRQEEFAASRSEHDRMIARLDSSMENANRQLGELGSKMEASRRQWLEEHNASRREYDRLIASIERSMDNLNRQLGNLGNQVGELNEAAFYLSLDRVLREDFHMDVVAPNVRARRQGEELELDMLAYANVEVNTVFDVEIKTDLDQEALDQILDHLRRFPRFFVEHRGKKLYGVLAAMKVPEGMRNRVLRHGLYLATIRDDVFDILRPAGFEPRAFPN